MGSLTALSCVPPPSLLREVPLARLWAQLGCAAIPWWGHGEGMTAAVLAAWRAGRLETAPHATSSRAWSRDRHARRAAFFCSQGWHEAPVVGVGPQGVVVIDGAHRCLAAAAMGHRRLTVRTLGDPGLIARALGACAAVSTPVFPMPTAWGPRPLSLPEHFRPARAADG